VDPDHLNHPTVVQAFQERRFTVIVTTQHALPEEVVGRFKHVRSLGAVE
jgi:hypothetical protein